MRAASQETTVTKTAGKLRTGRGLKHLCLLGLEKSTISALGKLLGKTFHLDVPASFHECLALLCARGRVQAFVVDAACCEDAFRLIEFLSERRVIVPTYVFTASNDPLLPDRLELLGVKHVFRKPREIWKLSEAIHDELGRAGVQPRTRAATRDVVAAAIDLIQEGLPGIRTAADVSRLVNVSREHLTRQFTKYTGCTLWHFVTACRIERAIELLREPGLPVKEISSRVGYACPSSFFRAFAEHTGLTPSQYRKACPVPACRPELARPCCPSCSGAEALKHSVKQ